MRSDDLVDIALVIRGLRTAEEASSRSGYILGRLKAVEASLRRLPPSRQRDPDRDGAVDWCRRSAIDAPMDDDRRAELLEALGEIKAMVGSPARATA